MLDWLKEHPYLAGGSVLALIILWVVFRNSNSGGSPGVTVAGPSDSLQALQAQTGAAISAAQIQSNTQQAGFNAAVNIAQLNDAADIQKTFLAAQVALNQTNQGTAVSLHQTDAALALGLAQIGGTPILPPAPAPTPTTTTVNYGTQYGTQQQTAAQQNLTINTAGSSLIDAIASMFTPGNLTNADSVALGQAYEDTLRQTSSPLDGYTIANNQAAESDYFAQWARLNPVLAAQVVT